MEWKKLLYTTAHSPFAKWLRHMNLTHVSTVRISHGLFIKRKEKRMRKLASIQKIWEWGVMYCFGRA